MSNIQKKFEEYVKDQPVENNNYNYGIFEAGYEDGKNDINYDWNLKHSMDDFKKLQEEKYELKKNLEKATQLLIDYNNWIKSDNPAAREFGTTIDVFLNELGVK